MYFIENCVHLRWCNVLWAAGTSDVLGQASSPEPAEPSPFKPKPSWALTRACSRLRLGFRFQKPRLDTLWSSMKIYD